MAMKMAAKSKAAPKHKETQKTRIKQEKTVFQGECRRLRRRQM